MDRGEDYDRGVIVIVIRLVRVKRNLMLSYIHRLIARGATCQLTTVKTMVIAVSTLEFTTTIF